MNPPRSTCPVHKLTLVVVFDHVNKRTYRYCQMCRPLPNFGVKS